MSRRPRNKNLKPADPDVTRERQLQELGSPERACVICGLAEPEVLQHHHVDGEANSDLQGDACLNDHYLIQASMRVHEDLLARAEGKSPLAQMAMAKFGRAALWERLALRQRAEGQWLLEVDRLLTNKLGSEWWKDGELSTFPGRILDGQ